MGITSNCVSVTTKGTDTQFCSGKFCSKSEYLVYLLLRVGFTIESQYRFSTGWPDKHPSSLKVIFVAVEIIEFQHIVPCDGCKISF